MTKELTHYVGGKHIKGTSGRVSDVYNPTTGEVQAKCPLASQSEMENAIKVATDTFPGWSQTSVVRRSRVMMKYLELCNAHHDELGELLANEHGKVFEDAKGSVQRGIEVIEFAITLRQSLPTALCPRAQTTARSGHWRTARIPAPDGATSRPRASGACGRWDSAGAMMGVWA